MGAGQPEMQRDNTSLQSKSEEAQNEDDSGRQRPQRTRVGQSGEAEIRPCPDPDQEHRDQGERARMGQNEIEKPRPAGLLTGVLEHDEEITRERHDLPRHEEEDDGSGGDDSDHGSDQEGEEGVGGTDPTAGGVMRKVGRPVPRRRNGDQADNQEKPGRELINPENPGPSRDRAGESQRRPMVSGQRSPGGNDAEDRSSGDQGSKGGNHRSGSG